MMLSSQPQPFVSERRNVIHEPASIDKVVQITFVLAGIVPVTDSM
jgi:hypothetical protein